MKKIIYIFLILFLIKIIESDENEIPTDLNHNPNINIESNETINNIFSSIEKVNISEDEIDKVLFCGALLQIKLRKDDEILEEIAKSVQVINKEDIYDKIGSYLLLKCFKSVTLKDAHKFFNGGLYLNILDEGKLNTYKSYHEIDYSIFKIKEDLVQTDEEMEIALKFHKSMQIHNERQGEIESKGYIKKEETIVIGKEKEKENESEKENGQKIKTVDYDLPNIPKYVKWIILIIVFGIIFGGILYYVQSIINKHKKEKKDKKDKKKKKKNE